MGDAILLIEILVLGILVIGFFAMIMTRGDRGMVEPLAEPLPSLPPVVLPEAHEIAAQDISDIRFAVGLRGYRTDQVDQVLERLTVAVQDRDQQISQLQEMVERQQHQTNE
ncbi:DivIVA domain-containing protein [Yaniella halotolerans]|uniref:DivIVA domain-containing protein n=1 Tax=Yaniella halotolerans TaxID=225453 RepID=UPI0003B5C7AB|nr:DivIVA domain-containing protein [Yaniella halotolerans]